MSNRTRKRNEEKRILINDDEESRKLTGALSACDPIIQALEVYQRSLITLIDKPISETSNLFNMPLQIHNW